MADNRPLYDRDFYAWAAEQATLLREGRFGEADLENIIEEIECLGRSEKRELRNRLIVLLAHLLKWYALPDSNGKRSWRATIAEQRVRLRRHLEESPSLLPLSAEVIGEAWEVAVLRAAKGILVSKAVLPARCPWSAAEVLDENFWPEEDR
jgi:hypothetical protein